MFTLEFFLAPLEVDTNIFLIELIPVVDGENFGAISELIIMSLFGDSGVTIFQNQRFIIITVNRAIEIIHADDSGIDVSAN